MDFITLDQALDGIAERVLVVPDDMEHPPFVGAAKLVPNDIGEYPDFVEALKYSKAAGTLRRDLHNLPDQRPRWVERDATGEPLFNDEMASEGMDILKHMAGWYSRKIKERIDHVNFCSKEDLDPETEPPLISLDDGKYKRDTFFRSRQIGFDLPELVRFLNNGRIPHGLGDEQTDKMKPQFLEIPTGTQVVRTERIAEWIAFQIAPIPYGVLVQPLEKLVPYGPGSWRAEQLTIADFHFLRDLWGGMPSYTCTQSEFEQKYLPVFESAPTKPDWKLHPIYKDDWKVEQTRVEWQKVRSLHLEQIEAAARDGRVHLLSKHGTPTNVAESSRMLVREAAAYLETIGFQLREVEQTASMLEDAGERVRRECKFPGLRSAIQEHLEKRLSELPLDLAARVTERFAGIGLSPRHWDEMTPEQRNKAAKTADESASRQAQYERQEEDKRDAGRYTLREAADLLEKQGGERAGGMLKKLTQAVRDGSLQVYEPGKQARYQCDMVRDNYEESYWDDLNYWLNASEPRIAWRFPKPAAPSIAAMADSSADEYSGAIAILRRERAKPRDIAWALQILFEMQDGKLLGHDERRFRPLRDRHDWILKLGLQTTDASGAPTTPRKGGPVLGLDDDIEDRMLVRVSEVRDAALVGHLPWPTVGAFAQNPISTTADHPVVFVSYSWSSPEHEDFVMRLATKLRSDGVDVRLDKWELKEGHDKYGFMESMVKDPTVSRVLVLCDRQYKEKADARAGGVGTETQIISAEIYGKVKQDKFVPVVCELDEHGQPFLPVFMNTRIFIHISPTAPFADGYDRLLRNIYDRPLNQKPELGKSLAKELSDRLLPIAGIAGSSAIPTPVAFTHATPSTWSKSVFWPLNEAVATLPVNSDGSPRRIHLHDGEHLYLRLIPSTPINPIDSTEALQLVRAGGLHPMTTRLWSLHHGRNQYGAFVYTTENHEEQDIWHLTQLFKTGELWGIDAYTINKEVHMKLATVNFGYISSVSFERAFINTLENYLRFARQTLNLSMPLKLVAGLTRVQGFKMGLPANPWERFGGHIITPDINYSAEIADYATPPAKILRPFFEYVWRECELSRPDVDRLE